MKNEIIKRHFLNPKNMGHIDNPTYKAISKSSKCNDIVKMMAVVNDNCFEEIKTEVFGCGYSIAGASLITDIVKGNSADGIIEKIENELKTIMDDIPDNHRSCITLSLEAFKKIYAQHRKE